MRWIGHDAACANWLLESSDRGLGFSKVTSMDTGCGAPTPFDKLGEPLIGLCTSLANRSRGCGWDAGGKSGNRTVTAPG